MAPGNKRRVHPTLRHLVDWALIVVWLGVHLGCGRPQQRPPDASPSRAARKREKDLNKCLRIASGSPQSVSTTSNGHTANPENERLQVLAEINTRYVSIHPHRGGTDSIINVTAVHQCRCSTLDRANPSKSSFPRGRVRTMSLRNEPFLAREIDSDFLCPLTLPLLRCPERFLRRPARVQPPVQPIVPLHGRRGRA
jgi:hypothetical protein